MAMHFKWNKEDKKVGVILVDIGYSGSRMQVGTIGRVKINGQPAVRGRVEFDESNAIEFAHNKASELKKFLYRQYGNYQNEMVTVKALFTGKKVQIRRKAVGGICDPSCESHYSV